MSCSPYVTSIGSYFLAFCNELNDLDLSGLNNINFINYGFLYGCCSLQSLDLYSLTNISEICGAFLQGCDSLLELIVPNKSPETFTVNSFQFMEYISPNTLICCNDYLMQYQKTAPWSDRESEMRDSLIYSISDLP